MITRRKSFPFKTASCLAFLSFGAMPPDTVRADDWTWSVAPYVWGTSLSGDVGALPGVPPVGVDIGFSDIWDNLDFAFMGLVNANNGQWGISGDLFHAKISASNTGLAPLWSQTNVRVTQTILTLTGEYSLSSSDSHELWALGGLRYWDISTDITLLPGINPGRAGTVGDDWVDPVIGLRGRTDIGRKTYLTGWLMAGGFGAGSDEMIDIFGGLGYRFSPTMSGVVGYRWLSVDRTDGAFVYDMDTTGPMFGLNFTF